jgi:hypothetical protein
MQLLIYIFFKEKILEIADLNLFILNNGLSRSYIIRRHDSRLGGIKTQDYGFFRIIFILKVKYDLILYIINKSMIIWIIGGGL